MALTAKGVALTEAHRKAQLRISAKQVAQQRLLWSRLDISDIAGSRAGWLAAAVAVSGRFYAESVQRSEEYVAAYQRAESGRVHEFQVPAFDYRGTAMALEVAGPVGTLQRIRAGQAPADAARHARSDLQGMASRQVLMGGRLTVSNAGFADPRSVGWRRVSDGSPCAFCAMLVTRGPVYRNPSTAGDGKKYHGHCGCTAEIVYGEWIPDEREQEFINAYTAAAEEATAVDGRRVAPVRSRGSTKDTILWRMRQMDLFSR